MSEQLSLFDLGKYQAPSIHGKPDWFDDVEGEFSNLPPDSRGRLDPSWEEEDRASDGINPETSISIPDYSTPPTPIIDDTGGGNSTPGSGSFISSTDCHTVSYSDSNQSRLSLKPTEGPVNISESYESSEGTDGAIATIPGESTHDGDRSLMLQNTNPGQSCSVASNSIPLTVEEGKAIWDDLIFGRKNKIPADPCKGTGENCWEGKPRDVDRLEGASDSKIPYLASNGAASTAISSGSVELMDQRKHNGTPGASGWISTQYKYRDGEGKSRTASHWRPGCTGPYYTYHWREGDRVRAIYLPRKKLDRVQIAIAFRRSVNSILDILG